VSNKAKNEPLARYAGVWQFVAMVGRNAKAWILEAGCLDSGRGGGMGSQLLSITPGGGMSVYGVKFDFADKDMSGFKGDLLYPF